MRFARTLSCVPGLVSVALPKDDRNRLWENSTLRRLCAQQNCLNLLFHDRPNYIPMTV
jgi:hypothetical protein